MSLRLNSFHTLMVVFAIALGTNAFAQPVFENQTPVGFSPSDSTTKTSFASDKDISILVDLNETANETYPVIGNFQKVEQAQGFFATASEAAYMDQAMAIDDNGIIHRAWVQQRGIANFTVTTSTPVYGVVYAKSLDGGKTFSDTVSVSGTLRFDMLTSNFSGTGGFSTLDIVINSKGNPRVVYAMDTSPDGIVTSNFTQKRGVDAAGVPAVKSYNNIYFNYSNDGGSSWLPANNAVVLNDTATIVGRKNAFPRMAVTSTDDIFVVYERNMQFVTGAGGNSDIMLAKIDADSLQLGSAQAVTIGAQGQTTSRGGVRLDLGTDMGMSPDIAVGDDDVLHVVWFNTTGTAATTGDQISHKSVPATLWDQVGASGWDQGIGGTEVGTFSDNMSVATGTNFGMHQAVALLSSDRAFVASTDNPTTGDGRGVHLFPTVVVDRQRTPDRIYALWKHTDSPAAATFEDENIAYNFYSYDGVIGAGGGWSATTSFAFPQGAGITGEVVSSGQLFMNDSKFQIEHHWGYVDRIAAVVDDRLATRGDLHIVFSGGLSSKRNQAATSAVFGAGHSGKANSLYYSRFNGVEWELPQVVATAMNTTGTGRFDDGVGAKFRDLFAPKISMRSGDNNVYLSFVGGSPVSTTAVDILNVAAPANSGRGYSAFSVGNIAPQPFFKVIGRAVTFEDRSIPVGGNQYVLNYNPVHPQTASVANMIPVTVADNSNGSGIGGATPGSSSAPGGFLTGRWVTLGLSSMGVASLNPSVAGGVFKGASNQVEAQNDNGNWEGLADDDGSSNFGEWGDDTDKNGLLVKLNVLDSGTSGNLFVIRASSASNSATSSTRASQSVDLTGRVVLVTNPSVIRGAQGQVANALHSQTGRGVRGTVDPPLGSYFQLSADIDIAAANVAPVVQVVEPDASTIGTGAFANETQSLRYVLFDSDNNVATPTTGLQMEMFFYTDNGLSNVQDIRTFATLIVDEQDDTSVDAVNGTADFVEGSSGTNVQSYTWDDPGAALQALVFAALTKAPDGTYFIYIVGDDLVNPAQFAVSDGALRVRHIPLVKSLEPVSTDTVDTGEFDVAAKTNPYNVDFQLVDYDDNAQVRLFFSTLSSITAADAVVTGTFPSQTLDLTGATPMQLSDTLRTDEDIEFDFDVTVQGSTQDITDESYIRANDAALDSTGGDTTVTLGLASITGTFAGPETVTGTTSGATGVVTSFATPNLTVGNPLTGVFSTGETVTGGTSAAVGNISTITGNAPGVVVLIDSVNVVSDAFGTFTLTEIPPGIYEITVKTDGYISGRTDTLNLFNGTTKTADPTFGSDNLGNLSPATPFGLLKGGDATGDNQVDVSDANLVFSLWNLTSADAGFQAPSDINDDGIINAIDLGFVSQNFGIDGFGAPPVFKRGYAGGDNENAVVELKGLDDVESWWTGREFEVNLNVTGMTDVMA
jgi:hypothetical protein